jgi:L-malate glycosyltransferase
MAQDEGEMKEDKLKIVFIGWANSEHVKRWVKWFAARGHEVHLISNIYEEIPGVRVHSFQTRTTEELAEDRPAKKTWLSSLIDQFKFNYLSYLRYPGYIKKTRLLLAEIKPDIMHGFYIGFAGYIGAFTGFHPFLLFTGGPDLLVFPKKSLLHRIWTKYALSKIDFLTHTSEEANAAAVSFGFPAARSKFLHIGIDLRQFNLHVDPGDLKARLGIAGHPMVLSTRGLFDKYYNITGLLKTFALVLAEVPEARLVLKYYSAPEKEKFVQLAHKLAIYDKIVWVGKAAYSDLPKYYRAADTYVSLSFTDSGPVSMLEAMACGSVPVVSNLKNIGEWVKEGVNGHLVAPNDHRAAAQAIIGLLRDKAGREAMGRNNVALIAARADQEKCFAEIEKVSYQLVEGKYAQ